MKKWIFVFVLYGLGAAFLYDMMDHLDFCQRTITDIVSRDPHLVRYQYIGYFMLPFMLLLVNYLVLRIRAKNNLFTFINAMFMSLLVMAMIALRTIIWNADPTFKLLFEELTDPEFYKFAWAMYRIVIVLCGINFIGGIVISEAKTKGAYLSAEFLYLLTGFGLSLFMLPVFF